MIIATEAPNQPDALSTFIAEVEGSLSKLKKSLAESPMPCGSRALAFAIAAGLPPSMAYTVSETARYMGLDEKTLRNENEAGRMAFILPAGQSRGSRIAVDEVDRWMNERRGDRR